MDDDIDQITHIIPEVNNFEINVITFIKIRPSEKMYSSEKFIFSKLVKDACDRCKNGMFCICINLREVIWCTTCKHGMAYCKC